MRKSALGTHVGDIDNQRIQSIRAGNQSRILNVGEGVILRDLWISHLKRDFKNTIAPIEVKNVQHLR